RQRRGRLLPVRRGVSPWPRLRGEPSSPSPSWWPSPPPHAPWWGRAPGHGQPQRRHDGQGQAGQLPAPQAPVRGLVRGEGRQRGIATRSAYDGRRGVRVVVAAVAPSPPPPGGRGGAGGIPLPARGRTVPGVGIVRPGGRGAADCRPAGA